MAPLETGDRESRLRARGAKPRIDAATIEVLRRFELGGVDARLLKGPSIAQWLYSKLDPRHYFDCDLLVAPSCLEPAADILGSLGYTRVFDDRGMPSWWREHAVPWSRESDGLTIDLHRTLPGVRVDDHAAWRLLAADAGVVVVAGAPLPALSLPGLALHVALHAAQHGVDWSRPLADLRHALAASDDDLWREAAALASKLEATEALLSGLRLTPEGEQLVNRLHLPDARSTDAELRASSPPPLALGFEQLARAQGVRLRLEIVRRKVAPPASFIRFWDPRAGRSRFALLRAYIRRPLWLLRRAPRGLRAWHRARCEVRATGRRNRL